MGRTGHAEEEGQSRKVQRAAAGCPNAVGERSLQLSHCPES